MEPSTTNHLTTPGNQNFFLSPQFPLQRQYEALRAYLVDEEPSAEVARRFGYSPGAFRVICHQFRHDPQKRASFFRQPQRGPQSSPARDRVRDLAVAMRKRNLSVYDMQRELAAAGHTISINSLTVLLREEGFSRLPRRADDERPVTVKPEVADVADVRRLDLSPCSFRTPLAGLFLFLPLLDRIDRHRGALTQFADDPRRPGLP
jgi:transposase-like protein